MTLAASTKVFRQRKPLDARTASMFDEWVRLVGPLHLFQGSFASIEGSANTHDGLGALDCRPDAGQSWHEVCLIGREIGFACWIRQTWEGDWVKHIHALDLGSAGLSDAARKQVQDYYAHLNALRNHNWDNFPRPRVITPFVYPLPAVDFSNIRFESEKTTGQIKLPGVQRVQQALNIKTGAGLKTDGIWGPVTASRYKRYEVQESAQPEDVDGKPGRILLQRLGYARYKVVD